MQGVQKIGVGRRKIARMAVFCLHRASREACSKHVSGVEYRLIMDKIKELQQKIVKFRDDRDWKQFHSLKNLAIDLSVEASELLEVFKWLSDEEVKNILNNSKKKAKIEEELADVFWSLLLFSNETGMDLVKIFEKKLKINNGKYPIEKCKGMSKKHDEL